MNYEEKYKQALERARKLYDSSEYVCEMDSYATIFPELKESEDEKIRKELLEHCLNRRDGKQICVDASDYRRWAAWLEKQGEQNTIVNESPSKEMILAVWELGNIWKELTKGSSCTEYGTQLQYIQKHWNESDYYEKLQGEQKPTEWSEEDDEMLQRIISDCENKYVLLPNEVDWLKSIKDRVQLNHWKPSEQNIKDLEWCADLVKDKMGVGFHRLQVFINEIKKL